MANQAKNHHVKENRSRRQRPTQRPKPRTPQHQGKNQRRQSTRAKGANTKCHPHALQPTETAANLLGNHLRNHKLVVESIAELLDPAPNLFVAPPLLNRVRRRKWASETEHTRPNPNTHKDTRANHPGCVFPALSRVHAFRLASVPCQTEPAHGGRRASQPTFRRCGNA